MNLPKHTGNHKCMETTVSSITRSANIQTGSVFGETLTSGTVWTLLLYPRAYYDVQPNRG